MRIKLGEMGGAVAPVVSGARINPAAAVGDNQLPATVQHIATGLVVEEHRARRAAELQDNIGRATAELGELELQFEQDTDFKTSPQRFAAAAQKIREKYVSGIQDDTVRAAFGGEFQKLALAKSLSVRRAAFKKETDYNQASLDANLDVYARSAAQAGTPEERELITRQAQIAITAMQTSGWISAEEAGKKQRTFLGKLDDVTVRRDIAADPSAAAERLANDPEYLPNLDPKVRQQWIDTAYRRADTEATRLDREERRRSEERADELLREAYGRQADGSLTREYIEEIRPFVKPSEYRELLKSFGKTGAAEDNREAFGEVQRLLYENPQAARATALRLHSLGKITDATLSSVMSKSRDLERTEGPRSPFERNRAFITNMLDPGPFSSDPAPKARMGLALKEFDDWADEVRTTTGKDPEQSAVEAKAKEVVKRYALIDMEELARKTGLGAQSTPEAQLQEILRKAQQLQADLEAGRIQQPEFNRRMAELNQARKAAEKARNANARP